MKATRRTVVLITLLVLALVPGGLIAVAQVGGATWLSIPLSEDPGISWMVLTENPDYRVLRDFAAPGATRRMHHHDDASWHVFTLATGKLVLTIERQPPVEVTPGRPVSLALGVMHTFKNVGTGTATIVEAFGKKRR